MILKISRIWQS